MMKCVLKKMSFLALSVVMVLCFMQDAYPSPKEEKPEVPRNIQLSVGTLSVGSLFYNVALALSTNMEDKLPWIVTPRPIASTLALPVNVSNKKLDFSIITNIDGLVKSRFSDGAVKSSRSRLARFRRMQRTYPYVKF